MQLIRVLPRLGLWLIGSRLAARGLARLSSRNHLTGGAWIAGRSTRS
jgi:hypothetical protein